MSQREELLEAAIVCLSRRGYAKTTSRDITATAQVSSLAAIVYHFGSKEALLNEAIAEIVRRWIGRLQQLVGSAGTGIDGLLVAASEYYDTLDVNQPVLAGFIEALGQAQHSDQVRAQLAAHYGGFRTSLAAIFDQDVKGHAHDSLGTVASLLMAIVDGLLIQWLLDPTTAISTDDLQQAVASLVVTFLPHNPPITRTNPARA